MGSKVETPERSSLDAYLEGRDDIPNRESIRFADAIDRARRGMDYYVRAAANPEREDAK